MYFHWQTVFNCIVSWPIQEDVVYFKSTSFPALGKALAFHPVKLRNFWQNLFGFGFFSLVCVILTCSLLQTEVVRGVARDHSFP